MTTCNAHLCAAPALPPIEARAQAQLHKVAELSTDVAQHLTALFKTPEPDRAQHRIRHEAQRAQAAREREWLRNMWLSGPRP